MSQTNVNVPGSGEGTGAGMIVGLLLAVIVIGFLVWWFLLNGGGGGTGRRQHGPAGEPRREPPADRKLISVAMTGWVSRPTGRSWHPLRSTSPPRR